MKRRRASSCASILLSTAIVSLLGLHRITGSRGVTAFGSAHVSASAGQERPKPTCSMHVLDASSAFGLPNCDLSSLDVWPTDILNSTEWSTVLGLHHSEGQHANGYWTAKAAREHPNHVDDINKADLVIFDTHCLEAWRFGQKLIERTRPETKFKQNPEDILVDALYAARKLDKWRKTHGRAFMLSYHWPGYADTVRRAFLDCDGSDPFVAVAEHDMFCSTRRDAAILGSGVLEPYVAVTNLPVPLPPSERRTLLYSKHGCASLSDPKAYSSGKILRAHITRAVNRTTHANETDVTCTCGICKNKTPHSQEMREIASSHFCLVLPGDTQASRRLGEVILGGCIPVFIGPPWHTLPLADVVDYSEMSVFVSVRRTPWFIPDSKSPFNSKALGDKWYLDAPPRGGALHVAESLEDLLPILRGVSVSERTRMHLAVLRARPFFSHVPLDGAPTSALTDLLLHKACKAATWKRP